jgi:hypothetical protein
MAIKGKNGFLVSRGKSRFAASKPSVGDVVTIKAGINAGKRKKIVTVLNFGSIEVEDKEFGSPVYYAANEYSLR